MIHWHIGSTGLVSSKRTCLLRLRKNYIVTRSKYQTSSSRQYLHRRQRTFAWRVGHPLTRPAHYCVSVRCNCSEIDDGVDAACLNDTTVDPEEGIDFSQAQESSEEEDTGHDDNALDTVLSDSQKPLNLVD